MGIEIRHLFVCCLAVTMLLSLLSLLCPAQTLTHGRRIADAGSQTYYVIADNGDLVTWGSNEPVPNMGKEYLPTPFWGRIVMLEGAVQVCTDGSRCIAVDREGNLWGWSNMGGWIPPAHKKPVLLMEQVKTADLAGGHIGVVKEDGTLWLWGSNEAGELGLGYRDTHYYEQPQQIMDHVSEIYAYEGVTFCIDLEGTLYACGRGTVYPSEEGREFDSVYSFTRLAERIRGVSSLPAMGQGHFALLTEEGEVFFWT